MTLVALGVVVVLILAQTSLAYAYLNRGSIGISVGASSVHLTPGQSTSVSVTLDPASDQQTQGCGMAECPQSCGEEGCLDANGQCLCAGSKYSTYYPTLTVSSSNGGVATASSSGAAVNIRAVGEGVCLITLTASLRQFTPTSLSISVTVSESGITGSAGEAAGATDDPWAVGITDAGIAQAGSDGSSGADEEAVVDRNGRIVHLVPLRTGTDVAEKLLSIAGTDEEMTFWYGGTRDRPDYSWTFGGSALDGNALVPAEGLDLRIDLSANGTGLVARLLEDSDRTLLLDCAHSGPLPAPATLYVAAPAYLNEGQALSLYAYDEQAGAFVRRLDGLRVTDAYIAFEIDHCSTLALSADDLTTLGLAALPDIVNPASAGGQGASGQDEGGQGAGEGATRGALLGTPALLLIAVGAALVLALLVLVRVRARQKRSGGTDA
jgi:hypothetical protein